MDEPSSTQPSPEPDRPPAKKKSRTRRGRGEGSIYRRADGLWIAAKSCGYDRDGNRVRRIACGTTKQQAQERLREILQTSPLDMLGNPQQVRLAEYLDQWLETVVKPNRARNTYVSYKSVIDNHVSSRIGGTLLPKLTSDHVAGLYAAMKVAGCSDRMRQLAHAVLHRALQVAVKSRPPKIPFNPCDYVEAPRLPRNKRHRVEPYSREEVLVLFSAAVECRLGALIIVAVYGGLRQGELFGLYWPDVNLQDGYLSVQRSLEDIKGVLALKETKSGRSRRVDLPAPAIEALWKHKARMLAEGHIDGPVFCNTQGGWLRKCNFIRQVWKPLLQRAGLPYRRFHDLRHGNATILLELGVHPKVVQERLGHSQISTTLDTYSHVTPTLQREATEKLAGVFAKEG
jgi:integrase